MPSGFARVVKQVCPPVLWSAARWLRGSRGNIYSRVPNGLTTLAEVDHAIRQMDQASLTSADALHRCFDSFYYRANVNLPDDPDSEEYRIAQMKLYRHIAGRDDYDPDSCEQLSFDLPTMIRWPYPYVTKSSRTVGEQLMAIGFLIRAMALTPGDRILEFGMGWGNTTLEFAKMGYPVTGVDINHRYRELVSSRARALNVEVEAAHGEMLIYQPARRFERVLFYESFHHCADPSRMIARLDSLVEMNGAVVFAGEPIIPNFPWPWGVRLDGQALWSIRKFGWLELGFRTDYFLGLLARHGWKAEILESEDVPWHRVFVARRAGRR